MVSYVEARLFEESISPEISSIGSKEIVERIRIDGRGEWIEIGTITPKGGYFNARKIDEQCSKVGEVTIYDPGQIDEEFVPYSPPVKPEDLGKYHEVLGRYNKYQISVKSEEVIPGVGFFGKRTIGKLEISHEFEVIPDDGNSFTIGIDAKITSYGKGLTDAQKLGSAYGELLERISLYIPPISSIQLMTYTIKELESKGHEYLTQFPSEIYNSDVPILWTETKTLSGKPVLVEASSVSLLPSNVYGYLKKSV